MDNNNSPRVSVERGLQFSVLVSLESLLTALGTLVFKKRNNYHKDSTDGPLKLWD